MFILEITSATSAAPSFRISKERIDIPIRILRMSHILFFIFVFSIYFSGTWLFNLWLTSGRYNFSSYITMFLNKRDIYNMVIYDYSGSSNNKMR